VGRCIDIICGAKLGSVSQCKPCILLVHSRQVHTIYFLVFIVPLDCDLSLSLCFYVILKSVYFFISKPPLEPTFFAILTTRLKSLLPIVGISDASYGEAKVAVANANCRGRREGEVVLRWELRHLLFRIAALINNVIGLVYT
jgi:hypothetical protein